MKTPSALRNEDGLSLIELIIVVVLIGIMGGAIAIIFVNSWKTQDAVISTTQATNRSQLMGQGIEKAMRNADAIRITSDGRYVGFRVGHTASGYTCMAFMVQSMSPADSLVSSASAPLVLPTAASTTWPQPWLSKNVKTYGGNPYFAVTNVGGITVLNYSFQVTTTSAPVVVTGEEYGRAQGMIVSTDSAPQGAAPCWS